MIAFDLRAALCTAVVIGGLGAAVTAQLPGGLYSLIGWERDGLLPLNSGERGQSRDDREIVTAILTHEAGKAGRGAICVRLAAEGEALASERREIDVLRRAAGDAAPARLRAELERRRDPVRAWTLPGPDGSPLGAENARLLQSAQAVVLVAKPSARVDLTLDMGALPANLRPQARDCPVLTFTAPALADGIAFVETRFSTLGRSPEDWLYALARTEGRWRLRAMASVVPPPPR